MTNRKDLIDPALLRPGRFEVDLALTLPTLEGRLAILRIHTKRLAERKLLSADLHLEQVARDTASFSGASLAGLVKSATSLALARIVANLPDGAKALPALTVHITADDFQSAIKEVRRAHGLTPEQLQRFRGPLLRHSDAFEGAWEEAKSLASPLAIQSSTTLADSGRLGRVASLLIAGQAGSGRTAVAASLAAACNFSFVGVLSADELRGAAEPDRLERLSRLVDDATASDTAVIILDDVERLLGHVTMSSADDGSGSLQASSLMIEALLSLLRRAPPAGNSLLVLGTTATKQLLGRTALLGAFDSLVALPSLEAPEGVHTLLRLAGAASSEEALHEVSELVPRGASLKQVLRALDLSSHKTIAPVDGGSEGGGGSAGGGNAVDDVVADVKASPGSDKGQGDLTAGAVGKEAEEAVVVVTEPPAVALEAVDIERFAALLSTSPLVELMAARADQASIVDVAHVKVVNSSEELEGMRWTQGEKEMTM